MLDGPPLDTRLEAITLGLIVPALVWAHPAFLRRVVPRALIVAIFALKIGAAIETAQDGIEALSYKVGLVLLVLGAMHFMNLIIFNRIHRRPRFARRMPVAESVVQA